jgi:hypothetical protein
MLRAATRVETVGHDVQTVHRLFKRMAVLGHQAGPSAIFPANSGSILRIFVAGIRRRPSRWMRPAPAVALTQCVVFVANHGRCPLTGIVEQVGVANGATSPISSCPAGSPIASRRSTSRRS